MQNRITIDDRGVITIPAKMREAFGIKGSDELIIEDTQDGLLIRPALNVPFETYTEQRVKEFADDEDAIGRILPPEKPAGGSPPDTGHPPDSDLRE